MNIMFPGIKFRELTIEQKRAYWRFQANKNSNPHAPKRPGHGKAGGTTKERKLFVQEAKSVGCYFCGETESACLDFHHKNPRERTVYISAWSSHSLTQLVEENEKCVVLCRNCHRKLHSLMAYVPPVNPELALPADPPHTPPKEEIKE